jgi:uncharacterized protein YbaP (TraB family)
MKKILGVLIILFCYSTSFAQAPTYQGLLWKITGNGLEKPSFLYGTMHVSDKVAFHLSDSFYKAIESVDIVSLEINPETWMQTMTSDDYVADNMGNAFSTRGSNRSAGFYKSIFELAKPENKEIGEALGAELGILNSLLYRTSNFSADFEEDTYLDLFIFQAGKKQGKEITGLEQLGATMRLNEIASKPEQDKKKLKEIKEKSKEKQHILSKILDGKSYGEVMENAYRLGDLDLLDSMSRMSGASEKQHEYIIVYRNRGMADAMDSIMQTKSLFAGVGAAHLPNSYGVINLLREKGYTVSPVSTAKTKYGNEVKDKLEETFITQEFTKQTSYDGLYSTMLPGPLYEFPESGNTLLAAYPDMANGAKYVVTRMFTFGALHGITQEQYLDKLDSLFFENIPGKIIEKKRIEIDGVPGFDIRNKTKKGDMQRYHVMVTNAEIIIFKASGKKEFVNRQEVNQFFSELHFYPKKTWEVYSPKNEAYTIEMPGTPTYEGENNSFMRGYWKKTVQSYHDTLGYYAVLNKSLMDIEYMEEDSFEIAQIARFFSDQFDYSIIEKKQDSTGGYASFAAVASKEGYTNLHVKTIAVGAQYYLLVAQTNDEQASSRFLNSFKIQPFAFRRPFETKQDTARMFSVVTNVKPPVELEGYYNYYRSDEEKDDSHEEKSKTAVYYSKESDETIYARMYKFQRYFYEDNIDSLWDLYSRQLKRNTYFAREENRTTKDDLYIYEAEVGDTNSGRNILVKHVLKGGVLFSLFTENDFRQPRSKFVSEFFETFTPWDTAVGTPILQNKVDLFLGDLVSSDSTTREAAYNSFGSIHFEDSDVPKVIVAYKQNFKFKHSLYNRTSLIEALGYLEHPSVVPFLTKTYREIGDSVQLQITILNALANQKTKKATKSFTSLITNETPLSEDKEDLEEIFYPFLDSLKLAKDLYPEVLLLTALPEYKEPVYRLLATLLDSNLIKPKVYKKHVKQLAWEANNAIKRQKGAESFQTAEFYKEESRNTLYSYNDLLEYYAILLEPYRKSAKAKQFYTRAENLNSPGFKIDLALARLKGGEQLPIKLWQDISTNKNDRIVLYQRLKEMGRLDLFPAEYNNHDTLAMSLYAQKARVNQYKDSLLFVIKKYVKTKTDSGYLYFYKSKEKKEDWVYGYIGLIDSTVQEIERYAYIYDEDFNFNKYEDESVQLMKQIREFEMRDRKRYRVSDEPEFEDLKSPRQRYNYGNF